MRIGADKNQFSGSHGRSNEQKHNDLVALGYEVIPIPLPFGDYVLFNENIEETIARRKDKLKKQDLVADYKVVVDTKKDLQEVIGNICSNSHERFRDELILAQKMNAQMYILIEDDKVQSFDDLLKWKNPRLTKWEQVEKAQAEGKMLNVYHKKKPPTSAKTLYKAMKTMEEKYGCKFLFCRKKNTARAIVHLLTKGIEEK